MDCVHARRMTHKLLHQQECMFKLIAVLSSTTSVNHLIYTQQKVITITSPPLEQKITTMDFITTLLLVIMGSASFVKATNPPFHNQNMVGAIDDMQRADYYTFVMLLNIAPPDLFQGNVTFLLPTDRMLAKVAMPENAVVDFLLRHSIPWPLLFDQLIHFPTGSFIPTSSPDFMLKVTNNGRQSFFFNNVRITHANICTSSSSIRCHGIDGVLEPKRLTIPPLSSPCQKNHSNVEVAAPMPAVSPSPPSTTDGGVNAVHQPLRPVPPSVDSGSGKQTSGSHRKNDREGLLFQITINVFLLVVSYMISLT